jgi:hypothetical protein
MDHMEAGHDFKTLKSVVREHVVAALTLAQGKRRDTAALLGVSRWTVGRLVKRFGLLDLATTLRAEGRPVLRIPEAEDAPEVPRYGHGA